jgi:RimJ/RimL family protein N-acetyltransferase
MLSDHLERLRPDRPGRAEHHDVAALRSSRHAASLAADGRSDAAAAVTTTRRDNVGVPFLPVADTRPVDVPWPPLAWPPPDGTVLRGPTVELRRSAPEDADELFAALDDDRCWSHVAGRPAAAAQWRALLAQRRTQGWHVWTVRQHGRVVGTTSYLEVSEADARLEIGFTVYSPEVWATRVNPETKLLLLTHCFEVLGAGRVQLKTDVRNARSQRAIERLGATYEGTLRRYQRRTDGTVRDTVLFAVIAEEWPAVRQLLADRLTTESVIQGPP